jgi:hypothetical protein
MANPKTAFPQLGGKFQPPEIDGRFLGLVFDWLKVIEVIGTLIVDGRGS